MTDTVTDGALDAFEEVAAGLAEDVGTAVGAAHHRLALHLNNPSARNVSEADRE